MTGMTYFGSLDDDVQRFPWRFKLSKQQIHHSMICQLIDGNPILLNDGYLVNHPMCQEAISKQGDNLLWKLIEVGFVKVMGRGRDQYGIAEMPERMAHLETFGNLISDKTPGIIWRDYRKRLEEVEVRIRHSNGMVPWAKLHAGSGFLILARRLLDAGRKPQDLGLDYIIKKDVLEEFLKRFIEAMEENPEGPRDRWKKIARSFSEDPRYNYDSKDRFVGSLMRLANEMYHYNQGIMLAAESEVPVAVETQVSDAFDDLLVINDLVIDNLTSFPRIYVPLALAKAPASKLVEFIDPNSTLGKARSEWISAKERFNTAPEYNQKEASEAAKAYNAAIIHGLKGDVKYSLQEELLRYSLGEATKGGREFIVAGLAAAVASSLHSAAAGAATLFATGFALNMLNKKAGGMVSDKYRLKRLEAEVKAKEMLERSKEIASRLKTGRVSSCLVIERQKAMSLAEGMIRYPN